MNRYKYIHILPSNDCKFYNSLLKIINEEKNNLHGEETLFVTPHQMAFDNLSQKHSNIILDNSGEHLINKYAPHCDWLFCHGMTNKKQTLQVKRKYFKKIIWRTWGGSRQRMHISGNFFKRIKAYCYNYAYYIFMRYTFGKSAVIGIANIADRIDIEQWHWADNVPLMIIPYSGGSSDALFNELDRRFSDGIRHDTVNIMVGHQGNSAENHVNLVKQLINYDNKELRIYVPLSYGDKKYIEKTCKELIDLDDSRIIIMLEFLPYAKYLDFIANIDVAFLDQKGSMALGNIGMLIHLKKKIFLHKDGILRIVFQREGMPFCLSNELANLSFEDLKSPVNYPTDKKSDLEHRPFSDSLQLWKDLYAYLDMHIHRKM